MGLLNNSNNNQYLLEFSFIGNHLSASLWQLDGEGLKSGEAMASLEYFDTRPEYRTDGYFGVRSGRYPGAVNGYIRDLEVQAIPEPSTAGLILMSLAAGGCFAILRRKQRRKALLSC